MTEVTCYTELIRGIDAARVEMGMRQLDFEVLIGMTPGHWGKAAGLLEVKKLGVLKIFDAMDGAGLRMRLEVDPEKRAKMQARVSQNFNPMQANQARNGHSSSKASSAVLTRVLKPLAKIGGKARWAGKSKKERSEHMKMMVLKRELKRRERKRRNAAHRRRRRNREAGLGSQQAGA